MVPTLNCPYSEMPKQVERNGLFPTVLASSQEWPSIKKLRIGYLFVDWLNDGACAGCSESWGC